MNKKLIASGTIASILLLNTGGVAFPFLTIFFFQFQLILSSYL
nr:hypothetical protein [Staphylococcus aureus]